MKANSRLRLFLLIIFVVGFSSLIHAQTGWKTYTDAKYKYSISYPQDWSEKDMKTYMGFTSPPDGPTDALMENVNVVVDDHTAKPVNLDELATLNRGEIKKIMGDGGKLVESKTTLLGMPTLKFDEHFTMQGYKMHIVQYFIIKNDVAYIFTYTALDNTFSKYQATAMKMIDTFKFPN